MAVVCVLCGFFPLLHFSFVAFVHFVVCFFALNSVVVGTVVLRIAATSSGDTIQLRNLEKQKAFEPSDLEWLYVCTRRLQVRHLW